MKNKVDMINGRLFPQMMKFAVPLILSSILQTLYNAADSLIVGRYGSSNALGAVGSVGPIVNTLVNLFMGLAIGTNVAVARYRGEGNGKMVKKTSDTAVIIALVSGIVVGILGFFIARPVAYLVKIDAEIIEMSILYMQIYFLGMPFIALYNFISATMRGIGDTKNPMISLVISGAINVVLNIIFVKYFFMGVAGVALATVISQIVGFLIILHMLRKSDVGFSIKGISFDKKIFKFTARIGIPAGIQGITFSISNTIMISSINSFGAAAAAGHSVESQVENILYVAINSIAQTVTTFTSQNIGARKIRRITPIMLCGFAIAITEGVLLSSIAYLFKDAIIAMFAPGDAAVASFAVVKFKYVVLPYFVISMIEIPSGTLRGMGATVVSMLMSLLGVCGFRLLWLLVLFPMNRTPEFLFTAYPASWFVTGCMYIIAYIILRKRMNTNNG
ncbi:MAG: MATE family efflux transporter [Clostridia bacterium]|nr:MATE family efflux transporter [Clostridia bacterium]